MENTTNGTMWNKAAKCVATRQVIQPPPCPAKVVEPNTASSSSGFKQYTLLDRLAEVEAQSKPLDVLRTDIHRNPIQNWDIAGTSKGEANVLWFQLDRRTRLQLMCCARR